MLKNTEIKKKEEMSQEQLAEDLRISGQAISRWKMGVFHN